LPVGMIGYDERTVAFPDLGVGGGVWEIQEGV
jgi:hypothetical protein